MEANERVAAIVRSARTVADRTADVLAQAALRDAADALERAELARGELRLELGAMVRLVECPFDRQAKKEAALLDAALRARDVIGRCEVSP